MSASQPISHSPTNTFIFNMNVTINPGNPGLNRSATNSDKKVFKQINIIKNDPHSTTSLARKITTQTPSQFRSNPSNRFFKKSFPQAAQKKPHSHIYNSSSIPHTEENEKDLIISLEGKRLPSEKESQNMRITITRAASFIQALQILSQQEFSPNDYHYAALFGKVASWSYTSLLFQN